ncbi:hypothetical protein Lal_00038831 [Lupinus albus]|uniref:Uncharacterized protein n=1 Tax=Lupinus albus TaxID=3870 RepID=A0A6A5N7Z2_LUPAL|nr:hypothetical protein Lalb_Chr20g0121791 [Lupinus albus]KAF1882187.1 hypothetical protein Lal_00038831 [Lupinus albus]
MVMENSKAPPLLSSPLTSKNINNGFTIPQPIIRSDSTNPYPTTFVQADTSSFKQVVQMLTGSSETAKQASSSASSPSTRTGNPTHHNIPYPQIKKNQTGFKLYERRKSLNHLKLNPLNPVFSTHNSVYSPRKPENLPPSILDFPSLLLSPVTPLIPDPFDPTRLISEAEEKGIKEKGFFLHPSLKPPTPRDSEPRLLPLFPTTSPRASGFSSVS